MKHVVESDMYFGDYLDDNFFAIEHSSLHNSLGEGIRTVEFVLLQQKNNILFVEAKKSCPNKFNKDESEEKQEKFEEYYREITEKFCDSLQMFLSVVLGKNMSADEMGKNFLDDRKFSDYELKFVLVIESAKDSTWLAGPKEELGERLKKLRKIWGVKIVVLDTAMAERYGLVKNKILTPS